MSYGHAWRKRVKKYVIKLQLFPDYAEWETLLGRYASEVNAQEKSKMMRGLVSPSTQWIMYRWVKRIQNYSKTKTKWHLWAGHEVSSTMPNFYLRAVFFVMESNICI